MYGRWFLRTAILRCRQVLHPFDLPATPTILDQLGLHSSEVVSSRSLVVRVFFSIN